MLISKISLVLMQEKDIEVQLSVTNSAKWVILQYTVVLMLKKSMRTVATSKTIGRMNIIISISRLKTIIIIITIVVTILTTVILVKIMIITIIINSGKCLT
jgi:hypothetical protein